MKKRNWTISTQRELRCVPGNCHTRIGFRESQENAVTRQQRKQSDMLQNRGFLKPTQELRKQRNWTENLESDGKRPPAALGERNRNLLMRGNQPHFNELGTSVWELLWWSELPAEPQLQQECTHKVLSPAGLTGYALPLPVQSWGVAGKLGDSWGTPCLELWAFAECTAVEGQGSWEINPSWKPSRPGLGQAVTAEGLEAAGVMRNVPQASQAFTARTTEATGSGRRAVKRDPWARQQERSARTRSETKSWQEVNKAETDPPAGLPVTSQPSPPLGRPDTHAGVAPTERSTVQFRCYTGGQLPVCICHWAISVFRFCVLSAIFIFDAWCLARKLKCSRRSVSICQMNE